MALSGNTPGFGTQVSRHIGYCPRNKHLAAIETNEGKANYCSLLHVSAYYLCIADSFFLTAHGYNVMCLPNPFPPSCIASSICYKVITQIIIIIIIIYRHSALTL